MFHYFRKQCVKLEVEGRKIYLFLSKDTICFSEKRSVQYPYFRWDGDKKYEVTEEEKIVVITNAVLPKYFVKSNEYPQYDYTQTVLKHGFQELTFRNEYQMITLLYRLETVGAWKMIQKEIPSKKDGTLFYHYINPSGWRMGYNIVVSLFELPYYFYQKRKKKKKQKERE